MGYYNNISIDTRTCGEAEEDARLDRRDGLSGKPARRRYSSNYSYQRRSPEEWAKINTEHNRRIAAATEELRKMGRDASGNPLEKE